MEQRASGGSRVRSPDDQEERLPSTQHSWHVSAPKSKICDPRVSRWEIFAPIPRLGYTLRVAWELGLLGVCSLQRLGSADSELQPPGTHCSNAALKIAQLTLISDIKQMCLASVLCHDDFIQTWVRRSHVTKCAWSDVTHVVLHVFTRSYKKSFINNLNSICILASQIKNVNHFCSLKWFTERLHQKT